MENLQFVDLNRRFRKLEQDAKSEDAALESYTASFFGKDNSFTWDDLLKESRVVILGEPGSGKTWELQERVRILVDLGEPAFFIRLDQLIHRDLFALFSEGERKRFSRWKKSNTSAYFFLDSVDEAKSHSLSDYYSTLQRLANELGPSLLLQTKIFLSSRISEWKPASDAFEIRRLFPSPPQIKDKGDGESKPSKEDTGLLVVHLQSLDQARVECLAQANSVQNVSAFIQALDRAFAWEFARRPLDVSELIGFWKTHGRIGKLTEMIEFDVVTKLRPRANRDEHRLSETEAFNGATCLAAASLFCRKFSFFVTDNVSTDPEALDPLACLPSDWHDNQVRALLNRAIFDGAVYGRFRFHHRRIGEFLAAKWLTTRMESGCSQKELEYLLIEEVRGRKVFRPAMRPVAAWLCAGSIRWNQWVRELVATTDPEIHLNFGDAASLSMEYRRQILKALAEMSKSRSRIWLQTAHDSLARFADPALAPDIRNLILNQSLAVDFRIEMLEIVRHGRLEDCLDAAISVVANNNEPDDLKQYAALAIARIDNSHFRVKLAELATQLKSIPNRLCSVFAEALFPQHISPSELITLLAKSEAVPEFSTDLPYHLNAHFESVVLPEQAGVLLNEVLSLAQRQPYVTNEGKVIPVSEQFYWLGELIPTILVKLFKQSTIPDFDADVAAAGLQLLGYIREFNHRNHEPNEIGKLNDLSLKQPRVRQKYLWKMVVAYRNEKNKEPESGFDLFDYWEVVHLSPNDFDWLLTDAVQRNDGNDRLLALRLAIGSWDLTGRPISLRWRLRKIAKRECKLWKAYQQSAYTELLLPVKRFWHRYSHFTTRKWWWKQKYYSLRRKWLWLHDQFTLYRRLKFIASGEPLVWLRNLASEADEKNHNRWGVSSWADLEKKRGRLVARAVKQGCIAVWRKHTPLLPHEKPAPSSTDTRVIVGLSGLQAELGGNSKAISNLSEAEATLATRYAMDELNGFPEWLEPVAVNYPSAVKTILEECLHGEWRFQADRENTHEVMARLSWRGGPLCEMACPVILALLEEGDPDNQKILRAGLAILTIAQHPPLAKLKELSAQRASTTEKIADKILWFSVWMQTDGDSAVKRLQTMLKESSNPDEIVILLCSALSGDRMDRWPEIKPPNYLQPASLRQFISIIYTYVRINEDINRRGGGAYTPTARDDAQHFRGVILDMLAKNDSPSATDCMLELADDPVMANEKDWILKLFDDRLERQADFSPWEPTDLRSFTQQHEVDPKSDRELFAIARKRIIELKYDVEFSNNSLRDELRQDAKEIHLRRWLARKLNERSRNRYNVPQEPEIDLQQRPDLQFLSPELPPVPVEAKLADLGWSISVLIERLENQLVGQYLRDHKTDYGIYVIGTLGRQKHWEHPQDGRKLTFSEMINVLSEHAAKLVKSNHHIGNLAVVGIDFSEPKRG